MSLHRKLLGQQQPELIQPHGVSDERKSECLSQIRDFRAQSRDLVQPVIGRSRRVLPSWTGWWAGFRCADPVEFGLPKPIYV